MFIFNKGYFVVTTAVLIPARNEAQTIQKVIRRVQENLPHTTIYVCDNNSSDNTSNLAKEVGGRVLFYSKKGKGATLRHLYNNVDSDIYFFVDGDDQYDLSKLKDMEDLILSGNDLVISNRKLKTYYNKNNNLLRKNGNNYIFKIIKFLFSKARQYENIDVLSGLRACNRNFLSHFPAKYDNFEVETEMTIYAIINNAKIAFTDCDFYKRKGSSKSKLYPFIDGPKILKAIFIFFIKYKLNLLNDYIIDKNKKQFV